MIGLSDSERILKPELNPQCPEHALWMIVPGATMQELQNQGESLFKKSYRNLMRTHHPDKTRDDEKLKEAAVRLNAAHDILIDWLKINT